MPAKSRLFQKWQMIDSTYRPCGSFCNAPAVLAPILHPDISVCLNCVAKSHKLPTLNLAENLPHPAPAALKLLPKELMFGQKVIPVSKHGKKVSVVMAFPNSVMFSYEVRTRLAKFEVSWFICDSNEFQSLADSFLNPN